MKRKLLLLLLSLASLALVSCGGGNDVASSGANAVSAAAPITTTTATASAPLTAATEPKVNGQIDERTGVAPVVAQMTISGFAYYYTVYRGSYLEAFTLTPNGYRACGTGSTANQAFINCLNSSANQFALYQFNQISVSAQSLGVNSYGAFFMNSPTNYPCGTGPTPNQAIISCVNSLVY
jgi:predicted small secreted protein